MHGYMCNISHGHVLACRQHFCPHPAGALHWLVSSLSSLLLAGNTTLEANEKQLQRLALQSLLLFPVLGGSNIIVDIDQSYHLSLVHPQARNSGFLF